jgi:hypothetical protein
MTDPAFRSLYYTDCRPGEGLRGGAGFQFQAISAGVDHETMTLVQRSSLYEAPVSWMRQGRPVADYPPSLSHVYDGVYVTARGVYLGAEANGVREGNQFTHAVATTDPLPYGQTRPAQLWGARWWVEEPAPSTQCAPVDAEPEPGPWSVDAIRDWVVGRPDGEAWLTALVSAFDRLGLPDAKRVLFIGEDPDDILGWIAAGTLLLPQQRALGVTFRVFATNPRYSQQDVLALHPDWAGPFAAHNGEYVVFNIAEGVHSPVEPTSAAAHWVPRFLRKDPYDVMDAVELAHQSSRSGSAGAADRLAASAIVLGERPSEAEAAILASWLADGPHLSTEDVVDPVAGVVVAASTDLAVLRRIDAALAHRTDSALSGSTRLSLLRAEVRAVVSGPVGTDRPAPPARQWPDDEAAAASTIVEGAANRVDPERMDALLRLARDFGVMPGIGAFRDGAHRFARWWADNPQARVEPATWPVPGPLVDQLRDELQARLSQGGQTGLIAANVHSTWWRLLRDSVVDPISGLDALVTAAVFANDDSARTHLLADVLARVPGLGPQAGERAWPALFAFAEPTLAELRRFLEVSPLSPTVLTGTHRVLSRAEVTAPMLDLLALTSDHAGAPKQDELRALHAGDRRLRIWLATLGPSTVGSKPGHLLRGIAGDVLVARREHLLSALLDRLDFPTAALVVDTADETLADFCAANLPAEWPRGARQRRHAAVALAMTCTMGDTSATMSDRTSRLVAKWARDADLVDIKAVGKRLGTYQVALTRTWDRFVAEVAPRKHKQLQKAVAQKRASGEKRSRWPFRKRDGQG